MLAVWKAGGAFLPLDPELPADRLAGMAEDAAMSVLLTADRADAFPAASVVRMDDPAVDGFPSTDPGVPVTPDQLAYVVFTSGSTGRPKGVQVSHRSVVSLVVGLGAVYRVGVGDVFLQVVAFSFDVAISEVVTALAAGGCLVVGVAQQRSEPAALARLVRENAVTVATMPPSLLSMLQGPDLAGVGSVVVGGERLGADLAARWAGRVRLVNGYGPTETTVCASAAVIGAEREGVPPIGAPLANVRLHVLDRSLNPVPVGAAGELFIAGAGVARGYAGRPELTAHRFVADPRRGDGSRMYRSGDRVRWCADGQVEFLGRLDDQIKVRGYRVEPAEVEAVLIGHPGVAAAVVVGGQRLVAYLVAADAGCGVPDERELRGVLRAALPEYMHPAVFVELAGLPLTAHGKVDRAALPAPEASSIREYVPPGTPTEMSLAAVWAEVLGVRRPGVHDNFFHLGGHSLLATQVLSRIRNIFAIDLPLAAVFDQPTIQELAVAVETRIWEEVVQMPEDEIRQTLETYSRHAHPDEDGASR
jgi:amino acid adenylation domain-containing protein